ncbi:MAG: hypothetical protein EBY28_25560 [Betaproteobacteria bacterium]|nr:hypothetical protein [Betaproteobacteria bacterium]
MTTESASHAAAFKATSIGGQFEVGGHFKHLHMFEASWGNSQYHSQRFARLTDATPRPTTGD